MSAAGMRLRTMRIVSSETVILDKGEIIPCLCPCGEIYPPAEDSEWSVCPRCGRENVHGTMPSWRIIESAE